MERIIGLRRRVRQRLRENAEVVGTDEAFFEDDGNEQVVVDLYNPQSEENYSRAAPGGLFHLKVSTLALTWVLMDTEVLVSIFCTENWYSTLAMITNWPIADVLARRIPELFEQYAPEPERIQPQQMAWLLAEASRAVLVRPWMMPSLRVSPSTCWTN